MLCRIALACRVMCCAGAQPEFFVGGGGVRVGSEDAQL